MFDGNRPQPDGWPSGTPAAGGHGYPGYPPGYPGTPPAGAYGYPGTPGGFGPPPPSSPTPPRGSHFSTVAVAILGVLIPLVVAGSLMAFDRTQPRPQHLSLGNAITPTADNHVVYTTVEPATSVQCTAQTVAGAEVEVKAFSGMLSIGRVGGSTRYWAVAKLPLDRGSLIVKCRPVHGSFYLGVDPDADGDSSAAWLLLPAVLVPAAAALGIVLWRRRVIRRDWESPGSASPF